MKKILLLLLSFLLIGCKSKQTHKHQQKESNQSSYIAQMDSLLKVHSTQKQSTQKVLAKYDLSLTSLKDSTGKEQDLEYIHEQDGKIIEKITLKGGVLHAQRSTEQTHEQTHTHNSSHAQKQIHTQEQTHTQKVQTITDKQVKVRGFHWLTYLWVACILIGMLLIWIVLRKISVLGWLKRFKL